MELRASLLFPKNLSKDEYHTFLVPVNICEDVFSSRQAIVFRKDGFKIKRAFGTHFISYKGDPLQDSKYSSRVAKVPGKVL